MNVLIAGISTRAAAESAARAGFSVTALDAFADADQHPSVRASALGESFSADAAARRAQAIDCDAVVYGANFENDPAAVTLFSRGRVLWGNGADVLRRVRDPLQLTRTLRRAGFAAPDVIGEFEIPEPRVEWLVKPRRSGGGHGVRRWSHGSRVPRLSYLQEFIDGVPSSIVFVAARGRAVPLGFSRQLIGDASFGSSGFRYCGSILTAAADDGDEVVRAASEMARGLSAGFDLVGVNGLDLVVRDQTPYAIEVNPRWCASMELVERAYGLSVFGAHAAACRDGVLPDFDLLRVRQGRRAVGKAVVFARRDCGVGDTTTWIGDEDIRDVPRPGSSIAAGRPVCTVFAQGSAAADCYAELVRRAGAIYARL